MRAAHGGGAKDLSRPGFKDKANLLQHLAHILALSLVKRSMHGGRANGGASAGAKHGFGGGHNPARAGSKGVKMKQF